MDALLGSLYSLNEVLRNLKATSPLGHDMTKYLQEQVGDLSEYIDFPLAIIETHGPDK